MSRILIADDDYFFRKLLSGFFLNHGCHIRTVKDGEECLLSLCREPTDLAVVDYHLPGITGDKIMKKLRNRNIFVPVIIVTGDNSLEVERAVRKHGPAYFLIKPFNINDLGEISKRIITNACL